MIFMQVPKGHLDTSFCRSIYELLMCETAMHVFFSNEKNGEPNRSYYHVP